MTESGAMTLADAARALARRSWVSLSVISFCLVGAALMTLLPEARYHAEADVAVSSVAYRQLDPTFRGANRERALLNEAAFASGDNVERAVRARLGELPALRVSVDPSADVLRFAVSAPTPEQAAAWANASAEAYLEQRQQAAQRAIADTELRIGRRLDSLQDSRDVATKSIAALEERLRSAAPDEGGQIQAELAAARATAAAQAEVLDAQIASLTGVLTELQLTSDIESGVGQLLKAATPRRQNTAALLGRNLLLGLLLGLVAATASTSVLEGLDRRVRTRRDLLRVVNKPVLAVIPSAARTERPDVAPSLLADPTNPSWNDFQQLRTTIRFTAEKHEARSLLVTGATTGDGATTTAVCLGAALAMAGQTTVLVDCDLRNPRLHDVLGVPLAPGLGDFVAGNNELFELENFPLTGNKELVAVVAGSAPSTAGLLTSGEFVDFLRQVERLSDMVIIDAAPVLLAPDSRDIARVVDGVVIVARSGKTKARDLQACIDAVEQVDGRVLGTVLVDAPPTRRRRDAPAPRQPASDARRSLPPTEATPAAEAMAPTGRSRFRQNFLAVARANAVARALPLAASPVLTRLFTPEHFAVSALFTSVVSVVASFATWRMDWALPNVREKDSASSMVVLGLGILAFTTTLLSVAVLALRGGLEFWNGFAALSEVAWLLPLAVVGFGVKDLLTGWYVRQNDLSPVSTATVAEGITNTVVGIGAGLAGGTAFGLPAARVASTWSAAGALLRSAPTLLRECRSTTRAGLASSWRSVRVETTWATLVAVVNVLSYSVPLMLLSQHYTGQQVGTYALMLSAALGPISVFSTALGQSFWAQAAQLVRDGRIRHLRSLYLQMTKRLALVSLLLVGVCAAGPLYVSHIFGAEQWQGSGEVLAMMTPMIVGSFIFSATNHLVVFAKTATQFFADVLRIGLSAAGLFIVYALGYGFFAAVLATSLASLAGHLLLFGMHLRVYAKHP